MPSPFSEYEIVAMNPNPSCNPQADAHELNENMKIALVQVGEGDAVAQFALPLHMVMECLEFNNQHIGHLFNLRGQALPYLRLAEHFAIPRRARGKEYIVVVKCGDYRIGLVVDRFPGEVPATIRPMRVLAAADRDRFCASATLADDSVAPLLDMPALVNRVLRQASLPDGLRLLASLARAG